MSSTAISLPESPEQFISMATIVRPTALVSTHAKPIYYATKPSSLASTVKFSMPERRKLPVLLFDVMDTIVRDPFYHDIPAFFKLSMSELLEEKHPTVWVEFEKGLIDEIELGKKFFKDGRSFDLEGLKECMHRGYSYLDGIEELLIALKQNSYEMHAFTNYPIWYKMVEEKLKLSKYLSWTFSSCIIGKLKPAPDSYADVLHLLKLEPSNCIFIDDRDTNVKAAVTAGMVGIHFKNADSLKQELSSLGIELTVLNNV